MSLRTVAFKTFDRVPAPVAGYVARNRRVKDVLRGLVNRCVPQAQTVVTVRAGGGKGLRLVIDIQVEKYYWTGGHEPHVQMAIAENLREGQTFWDVGAHIGFFALQAARAVGPSGHVVAFEPMPANRERLLRNAGLNDVTNMQVIAEAIGEQVGELPIYSRRGSTLMWTLDPSLGTEFERTVPVRTLDSHLEDLPLPDMVKVDAEGLESAVLAGAKTLIATRSSAFLVEFMSDELLAHGRQTLAGYSLTHLDDNHWLATP